MMKHTPIAAGILALGLAGHAAAQDAAQRITITGSSIKRIQAEGALPVQVITRVELDRQGIVSAEQLVSTLTMNSNGLDNLASNADVVAGAARGNNGSTSANLRNQGANATLILLNGRRVAAHGVNGGVVDLNQIPMAAVERIEVLKDGASSVYGTDAVGGVINFILRSDFAGLRAAVSADATEAGGGNIYRASLTGGLGNLESDRYNLLAVLSVTDNKILNARDRDFVNTFQPERGLSPDTRGTPFATLSLPVTNNNIIRNVLTRPGGATNGTGPLFNGAAMGTVNTLDLPGGAGCASQPGMGPYDERLWLAGPGAQFACAYDTGRAVVIQQPVKNTNLVTRGQLRLGEHTLTAEWLAGKSESAKRFSENQIQTSSAIATVTLPNGSTTAHPFRNLAYPSTGAGYARVFNALVATFPELAANNGLPMTFRWRCMACGEREYTTTTDTGRLLLAADGVLPKLGGWEYRVGVSEAFSKSTSLLGSGYHNWVGLARLLNTGVLNPFLLDGEQQTPEAMQALDAISARGTTLYGGKYTTTQVDARVSGPLWKMPAGDVLAAFGADFRQEKYRFEGNTGVNTNDINSWIFNAAFDNVNALEGVKRDVKAVLAEVIVPVFKSLEVNVSGRYDEYSDFGHTTNPKISLRWAPQESFVVRASYGTGFRVPTFNQLYNGRTESLSTGAGIVDPKNCPSLIVNTTPGSPCNAITGFDTWTGGRRELQPEESKMTNVGFVWQPVPEFSASADWWEIRREGTIQTHALGVFVANYALFSQYFIRDPATDAITDVDTRWVNTGETRTKGIEVSLRGNTRAGGWRIDGGIEGSYLLEKKSKLLASSPFGPSEVGVFTRSSELGLRWKHMAWVNVGAGDWVGTLRSQYSSKYADFVPPGVANGAVVPPLWDPVVKSYTLWHASVSYTGVKNLTLVAGIKNLFDTPPPYANNYDTALGTGSSWEPRVADPRGRSFVISADYRFF